MRLHEQILAKQRKAEPSKLFPVSSTPIPLLAQDRKRKRADVAEDQPVHLPAPTQYVRKRSQPSAEARSGVNNETDHPVSYWIQKGYWPAEYLEQSEQTLKDIERDSWLEKYWEPNMSHLLARKKSSASLRGENAEKGSKTSSSTTPSDQQARETKSDPYKDPRYETLLATKGSFMHESILGITDTSKAEYQNLLNKKQNLPQDSLFRDDLFESTCRKFKGRNETRVIRDISLLIVPSAETLATYGATNLECLIESTNGGWNNCIPFTKTRPQPDYSVGFRREAFTEDQLQKLQPFTGDLWDTSFFMGTYYMYFPFLTCEVKSEAEPLNIADRQNAHSMTLAVRGIVEIFRYMNREKELHREILAFSISHDDHEVRIYGHYPVIDGKKTTFYRHRIHASDFTILDGKDKWTAYQFTKNIYDVWMPKHFKRLRSVVDEMPLYANFEVSRSELSFSEQSGLSQQMEGQNLSQTSEIEIQEEVDTQSTKAFKKPKKRPAAT